MIIFYLTCYPVSVIYLFSVIVQIINCNMKSAFLIALFILFTPVLNAHEDSLSLCLQGLSIHPENQEDLAESYDRKLDAHGDFVFTPGFSVSYDKTISSEWFSHVRFTGGYMSDCAALPAGFIGAGGVFPVIQKKYYSLYGCIGAGLFARDNWEDHVEDYYSPVMQQAGKLEWILLPYPEIEFRFHPWRSPFSVVVSFFSVIYVSQLSAGVQLYF